MRPGDTWKVTFALSGAATGTPTAKLLHNGVADPAVGSAGVLTATSGADPNEWLVTVTIPASGYAANDTIEISATATVSGTTSSAIVARAYIDPPVTVAGYSSGQDPATLVWSAGVRTLSAFGFSVTTSNVSAISSSVVTAMATAPVGSVANLSGVALDGGTVSAGPSPTTTSFAATGNLNAPAGGYSVAPMVVLFQTGINRGQKFQISAHTVSGSNHTFTVAAMPNAPPTGDTFLIG